MNDQDLLNEYVAEHDRILGTCDAYDVKASIWLAVIIFLAVQTGDLLGEHLPKSLLYGQWLSAVLLVLAGICTLVELYPRDYKRYAPSNGVIERWLPNLRGRHEGKADAESVILHKTTSYRLLWFKKMIAQNKVLNCKKANLLLFSFWTAAIAAGNKPCDPSYPPPLFSVSIGSPSGSGSGGGGVLGSLLGSLLGISFTPSRPSSLGRYLRAFAAAEFLGSGMTALETA